MGKIYIKTKGNIIQLVCFGGITIVSISQMSNINKILIKTIIKKYRNNDNKFILKKAYGNNKVELIY